MLANRILDIIISIIALPVVLLQFVTTFLLGLLVSLSFGLLLLPISLVWLLLLAPMLGTSWLCHKLPILRDVIGILGIPWVVLAEIFVCLMPSMGEVDSRATKLMLCQAWPYTWEFWNFSVGRLDITSPKARQLEIVVTRITRNNPVMKLTVKRIINGEQLDPNC